ncbi:hypothetical protein CBR_g29571 [Chara braunii]|uniref:Uncharacterized protein n=1 Tax=Chara braunii TaxID=69332 RepID=A0A388LAX0_CHABU|nr:hypothetical protein CBR_g29571 [Chara braunii]|eukprot:GBG79424.1 hypothetical protein CBR_g29571 [Chara braunii]
MFSERGLPLSQFSSKWTMILEYRSKNSTGDGRLKEISSTAAPNEEIEVGAKKGGEDAREEERKPESREDKRGTSREASTRGKPHTRNVSRAESRKGNLQASKADNDANAEDPGIVEEKEKVNGISSHFESMHHSEGLKEEDSKTTADLAALALATTCPADREGKPLAGCYMVPEDVLRKPLMDLKRALLNEMEDAEMVICNEAERFRDTQENSLTRELDVNLRKHRPRAGHVEEDLRHER